MTQEGFSLPNGLAARRFGFGKIDRLGEFFSILPGLIIFCVGEKFNLREEFLTLLNALSNLRLSYPTSLC